MGYFMYMCVCMYVRIIGMWVYVMLYRLVLLLYIILCAYNKHKSPMYYTKDTVSDMGV